MIKITSWLQSKEPREYPVLYAEDIWAAFMKGWNSGKKRKHEKK